jgi:hypothetical protein
MASAGDPAVVLCELGPVEAAAANLRRIVPLPHCGRWTPQERLVDVNDELLAFLGCER